MTWEEKLAIYDQIVDLTPNITRLGKTMPYTADNTHMFSLLNKDGQLGIRLGKTDRATFHEKYTDEPYTSYGATMKDYVLIPDDLLSDLEHVASWLEKGHSHVLSLKANPRKKK